MPEKVARLLAGVDIKKLKLDATDGFLLTRIDGKLTPKDLSRETGLPDFSVDRALEKLVKLGVIEIVDPNAPPPAPPPPPVEEKKPPATFDIGLLAPRYDPSELEQPGDLTPEQKKKVLDYFTRLDDLDLYMLLGVTKEADKKTIKRAYNALAVVFHPDRYFKKDLGTFGPKIIEVFERVTEAHDTLVDLEKRAEYDAYMAEVENTRGMEAQLERAQIESQQAAAKAAAKALAEAPPVAQPVPPPPPSEPIPAGPSQADINARKAALAARLRAGGRPPPPKPVAPAPNPLKYTNTQDAMDALKRRYEQRVEHATHAHAQRYVQAAEDSLSKNDLIAAASALSIASKFAPEDADLATRAVEVKQRADKVLCASYLKQARYEEKQRHWNEAAKSWLNVVKFQDDAESHERCANAILRSDEPDLREAAEHAKRAITHAPQDVMNHITLVEVYIKAGLATSAKKGAEAAHALAPDDERVKALLKRMTEAAK